MIELGLSPTALRDIARALAADEAAWRPLVQADPELTYHVQLPPPGQ